MKRYYKTAFQYLLTILFCATILVVPQNELTAQQVTVSRLDNILDINGKYYPQNAMPKPVVDKPCVDCIEIEEKRTITSTEFVSDNKHYIQQSNAAVYYETSQGLQAIVSKLFRDETNANLFKTSGDFSVRFDISDNSFKFIYKNVITQLLNFKLLHLTTENELVQDFGEPDLSRYTIGENGFRFYNLWRGIDLEIICSYNAFETNLIINNNLHLGEGKLVLSDRWENNTSSIFKTSSEPGPQSSLNYENFNGELVASISACIAYEKLNPEEKIQANYTFENNILSIELNTAWLNAPERKYPVVIDPVVSNGAGTGGSGSTSGECGYNLSVTIPGDFTITGITHSFSYTSNGGCTAPNGFYRVRSGTCTSSNWSCYPSINPACNGAGGGTATNQTMSELMGCVPQPTCSSYQLPFQLFLWNDAGVGGCGGGCITGGPWAMNVEGEYLQLGSISPTQTSCELSGVPVNLYANVAYGVGPVSYSWSPAPPNGQQGQNVSFIPLQSQTYTLTATDACGNTVNGTTNINLIQFYNPGFTINPNPVCDGQTAIVAAAGGTQNPQDYDWTMPFAAISQVNGATSTTVTYNFGNTNTEVRQIFMDYHTQGCVFRTAQYISIKPILSPSVYITPNTNFTICQGFPLGFVASATYPGLSPSYQWQVNHQNVGVNAPTFTSNTLNNLDTVNVILTSTEQCVDTPNVVSAYYVVHVYPSLTATVIPDTIICVGQTAELNVIAHNGNPPYQYMWQPGNMNAPYQIVQPDTTTVYTLTITDACNQILTTDVTIFVKPNTNPGFILNPDPVCVGDDMIITGLGGADTTRYNWAIPGSTQTNIFARVIDTVQYIAPGIYAVTLNFQDGNCTFPLTQSIEVLPYLTPEVVLSNNPFTTICNGDTMFFNAINTGTTQNNIYQWVVNGNTVYFGDSLYFNNTFVEGDEVYVIQIPSDVCLTKPADTSNIVYPHIYPPLEIQAYSDTTVCPKFPVTLFVSVEGGTGPSSYHYVWHTAGFDTIGHSETITTYTSTTTAYVAAITDNCPFPALRDTVIVTVAPRPTALYSVSSDTIIITLEDVIFYNEAINNTQWYWNFGDGDTSSLLDPIHVYTDTGVYISSLIAINDLGCTDTAFLPIKVLEHITYYLPNSFTPNGDDLNDEFGIIGFHYNFYKPYEMRIFNRGGEEMFFTSEGEMWNGKKRSDDKILPEGVYVYTIKLFHEKALDRFIKLKGIVTLVH